MCVCVCVCVCIHVYVRASRVRVQLCACVLMCKQAQDPATQERNMHGVVQWDLYSQSIEAGPFSIWRDIGAEV